MWQPLVYCWSTGWCQWSYTGPGRSRCPGTPHCRGSRGYPQEELALCRNQIENSTASLHDNPMRICYHLHCTHLEFTHQKDFINIFLFLPLRLHTDHSELIITLPGGVLLLNWKANCYIATYSLGSTELSAPLFPSCLHTTCAFFSLHGSESESRQMAPHRPARQYSIRPRPANCTTPLSHTASEGETCTST